MESLGKRSFGQELNTWVQTIGIIIAAGWGAYTFIYKEIKVPKSAPINITVNLEFKKIRTAYLENNPRKKGFVPVEMKVSVKNPSSRTVYILANAWIALGHNIAPLQTEQSFFITDIISDGKRCFYKERHFRCSQGNLIAFGGLLPDYCLKPLARNNIETIWDDRVLNRAYQLFGGIPRVFLQAANEILPDELKNQLTEMTNPAA